MPIALTNIGWRMYEINSGWNIIFIAVLWYTWIETKGKTLEEIDAVIEGRSISDIVEVVEHVKGVDVGSRGK
jgi:hypothetical protein